MYIEELKFARKQPSKTTLCRKNDDPVSIQSILHTSGISDKLEFIEFIKLPLHTSTKL